MKYPLFKRRLMEFVMANYYARNTDVWVLGSREQYQAFRGLLLSGKGPERIVADVRGGMDLLVLPPAADAVRDFFVLHERLVYQSSRFNMELIIGGTKRGLGAVAVADDLPALKEKAEAGRLPFFYLTPVDGAGPQSHETTSPAIFH